MTNPTDKRQPIMPTDKLLPHFHRVEEGLALLEQRLGYEFLDKAWAKQALTHRSFDSKKSYERLEFVGDALLSAVVAQQLYTLYPTLDEGRLTRMRATLVRQETLAVIAHNLQLYRHVILGVGERKSGGRQRESILADVVEALIGAIYQDSTCFEQVRACVLLWYGDMFHEVNGECVLKDAKSRLQEWLQARHLPLPTYEMISVAGNAPEQVFTVSCAVALANITPITQSAPSRRIAEQKCAELMINQLNLSQV